MGDYTNQTLIANWYEDRLDNSKLGKDAKLHRTNNVADTPIKTPGYTNSYRSLAKDSYRAPPKVRPETFVPICNSDTIDYVLQHPVATTMPRHGPERERRDLTTTSHVTYGGPYSQNSARKPTSELARTGNEMMAAGMRSIQKPPRSRGGASAVGEDLNIASDRDPKGNTYVQRSWRYNTDVDQIHQQGDFKDTTDFSRSIPGLGLNGLGVRTGTESISTGGTNFAIRRRNDAYSDSKGIWCG